MPTMAIPTLCPNCAGTLEVVQTGAYDYDPKDPENSPIVPDPSVVCRSCGYTERLAVLAAEVVPVRASGLLEEAIIAAAEAHWGQVDKQGQPYILHPLRVMLKFSDETHRIVAVLHDVVEDSEISRRTLLAPFGAVVADALDAITRRKDRETYTDYIIRCRSNPIARAVKLADIEDNLSRIDSLPDPTERENLRRRYEAAQVVLRG